MQEQDQKEAKGAFRYDKDTFRFHRFFIEAEGEGIKGTVYISKECKTIPDRIVLQNANSD